MNAVKGTTFVADFPVFTKTRKGKYIKDVRVSGVVTIDTCYASNDNKHWIYYECTKTSDSEYYNVGVQYRKQGKNFYPAIVQYEYPENYEEAALRKQLIKQTREV
jgi:hypothetical protein